MKGKKEIKVKKHVNVKKHYTKLMCYVFKWKKINANIAERRKIITTNYQNINKMKKKKTKQNRDKN